MARPRFRPGSRVLFEVKARSGKKSLAGYLASRLGVVETWASDLLSAGAVSLDGKVAHLGDTINLSAGRHEIEVRFPETWPKHMAATPMDLTILYEDEWLLALNKPPGVVVHPARGHLNGQSLLNGVRHRYREQIGLEGVTLGPPHRLDQDTSGVVLFALRTDAYIEMVRQFTANEPRKEYLALVDGTPSWDHIISREAIGIDPDQPKRGKLVPVSEGGKEAETFFQALGSEKGMSLLLAKPHTGRPHQIRLHAAGLGLPGVGDKDYHPEPERFNAKRQALHALSLSFTHPIRGNQLVLTADFPHDLRELWPLPPSSIPDLCS